MRRSCCNLLVSTLVLSLSLLAGSAQAQNAAVNIKVDAALNRHAINPNIYGVAYGDANTLSDLNIPLNRYGGNNTSRYNWALNADNRGSDFFFESIGESSSTPGGRGDTIVSQAKAANAQAMITLPLIGWVAKLGANRNKLASFSISKYGPQTNADWQYYPDAGNGVLKSTGQNVVGNDPNDANVPSDAAFQNGWIQHLVQTWGTAANGGLKYYIMDNEPSLWSNTHRDVHPVGATMAEVRDKILDYGGKVKANDSSALVVGPEEWGWSGYFYSGFDQQYGGQHGWNNGLPDRAANGGADYLPWLLDQLRQKNVATGKRILDVFSVHYYPQAGEFSNDVSNAMQLLRNQSTRALWDPNYVDQSWIGTQVQLIPRLKQWVNSYYPGTQTAITEYNWGAEASINGATAQADIWGIFGREGLDMAARWAMPDPSTPTYKAMKLYRNYDGAQSAFGETSVSAAAPNPDNVSAFASQRSSDGALTIMVISKYLTGTTPVTLNLSNFSTRPAAQTWQLTAANVITRLADTAITGSTLTFNAPAQSMTLLVVPPGTSSSAVFVKTDSTTQGNWKGVYGADGYRVIGDTASLPAYASLNASGQSAWTWVGSTADVRALQKANAPTDRIAACDYASTNFSYDLNLTDGQSHQVALYCLDWDVLGRSQTIQIYDAATNTLLDSQSVSSFSGGKYLVWTIKGHVSIKVTNTANSNVVISGVFFAPSSGSAPQVPIAPSGLAATAGNAQVSLSWSAVSGASSYNVYRATTSGGEGSAPIKTGITGTANVDTTLTNGTTYFYKVSAVNSAGESPLSSEVSGIPTAPASSGASAVFMKTDSTTQGNWKGVYGADGYRVIGDTASLPAYASLNASGQSAYTWAASTSDVRALQKANAAADRIASCDYAGGSFTYDLNLTDGQSHQVAFYCLDWDALGRSQTIQIYDAASHVLLDSQSVNSFSGGKYLVWNLKGHVSIKVTTAATLNTVLSGVFFAPSAGSAPQVPIAPSGLAATAGNAQVSLSWTAVSGATSYNLYRSATAGGEGTTPYKTGLTGAANIDTTLTNGTIYYYKASAVNSLGESPLSSEVSARPAIPVGPVTSAVFVKTDSTTQGNWKGVYGADGYRVMGDTASLPAYASLSASGQSAYTWAASTSDVRAPQKASSSTDRIAACDYASGSFSYDLNLTDGQSHQVALYCLDWDVLGRSQTIQIYDAATNTLLDSQSVSSFSGGKYLAWNLKGHVSIKVTDAAALNVVISGVFFK